MRAGWILSLGLVGLVASGQGFAADPAGSIPRVSASPGSAADFFESSVRPLLVRECQSCHGPAVQRGGLRLDSGAALSKGGVRGPVVRPGDPAASLLIQAVKHQGGVAAMPPGRSLSARDLSALESWVRQGAVWPQTAGTPNPREHWSFQPMARPVPPVAGSGRAEHPVDAFLHARMRREGLRPAPPADRATLIRRVTYDLTGLPPTPEDVDRFAADHSPGAWERVIDRLLASSRYGERWGRHWLDVARYADSNGLDENVHYGNAWRYRNWVIDQFNRGLRYDQFLQVQLAGDLLPDPTGPDAAAEKRSRLVATGYLAIGPKFISEVDSDKVLMDLADEQVDSLGKTVLGMTFGCARCHDHKFDPISSRDYYALAGIFKSTKILEVMKKPRMWFEHSLATPEQHEQVKRHQANLERLKDEIRAATTEATQSWKQANPGKPVPSPLEPALQAADRTRLAALRDRQAELEKLAPELPLAMGMCEGDVADLAVCIRGDHTQRGAVIPRGFPAVLSGGEKPLVNPKQSGRLELAHWITNPEHPLTARVWVNRVWRWHFGSGLVRSTENFGVLGEKPSHPELLDWLARRFVQDGWDLKRLHRLLLTSQAYQRSSRWDPAAQERDPENRFWWRFPLRRLSAEELRDSLLLSGDLLDPTPGEKAIPLKNREYLFDHTSKDLTKYDSRKRSVYLPVVRNNLYDVFQLFDFGDGAVPDGNRATTTVAPQALFLLNSDLVQDSAAGLAARALRHSEDPVGRLQFLYRTLFARQPTAAELTRCRRLVRDLAGAETSRGAATDERAWSGLCHTLLASNEFAYLR